MAVVTSFTCTLSCISPKSNKSHTNSKVHCTAVVGTLKIHITSESTLWYNMWIPIAFHCVLKKTLEFPCRCDLKCVCCQKKDSEAVVDSETHCNPASKLHSCRLWMFSHYHHELNLGARFFLSGARSIYSADSVV